MTSHPLTTDQLTRIPDSLVDALLDYEQIYLRCQRSSALLTELRGDWDDHASPLRAKENPSLALTWHKKYAVTLREYSKEVHLLGQSGQRARQEIEVLA